MQLAPPLLLLLLAVAAGKLLLECTYSDGTSSFGRFAQSLVELRDAKWEGYNTTRSCLEPNDWWKAGCWKACVHYIIKRTPSSGLKHMWHEKYDGCFVNDVSSAVQRAIVRKHCAVSTTPTCVVTQHVYMNPYATHGWHNRAYLCCCQTHNCSTPDIYAFAEEQEALLPPKPPSGPPQKVTCEVSMRNATTANGLRLAAAEYERDETCEATWAPCVEFVYKNEADGLWRRWRAGCSYNYSGRQYTDVVELVCLTSFVCGTVDMIEPESRVATLNYDGFLLVEAYVCCCSGAGCSLPDTVRYSQGEAQTPPPTTTTATTTTSSTTTTTTPKPTTTKSTTPKPTTTKSTTPKPTTIKSTTTKSTTPKPTTTKSTTPKPTTTKSTTPKPTTTKSTTPTTKPSTTTTKPTTPTTKPSTSKPTTTKTTTTKPTTTMTTSKAQPSTPQGSTTELSSTASATSTGEQSSSAPERSSSTWTDDDDDYDDYDDATESPGGGGLPVWLLVAIAAAVVVGAVVAAAVVVARRRTREIHDDGLLPASLFPKYPWQPNKPGAAPVSAQKSGAKSTLADTQTTESATAASSSATPSQPDQTQPSPSFEAQTQHTLSAEATTQQQGDDSKARSPEGLST